MENAEKIGKRQMEPKGRKLLNILASCHREKKFIIIYGFQTPPTPLLRTFLKMVDGF
jgi:hypothetical protein